MSTPPLVPVPAHPAPSPGPSGAYTVDEMLALAYVAGWRDKAQAVAVAISHAESSWNPIAEGHNPPTAGCPQGSIDRGLWQINSCYHPEVSQTCAFDARCNADHALLISSHGRSFTPWSTFLDGAYRKYLPAVEAAQAGGAWQHHVTDWGPGGVFGAPQPPQGVAPWDWSAHVKVTGQRAHSSGTVISAAAHAIARIARIV